MHNPAVLAGLRAKGIAIADAVTDVRTHTVMVTAHGASDRTIASTRALGLHVVEATCPLVHVAHRAIKALVRDGYHPVIIDTDSLERNSVSSTRSVNRLRSGRMPPSSYRVNATSSSSSAARTAITPVSS